MGQEEDWRREVTGFFQKVEHPFFVRIKPKCLSQDFFYAMIDLFQKLTVAFCVCVWGGVGITTLVSHMPDKCQLSWSGQLKAEKDVYFDFW
jgi:hypothetical protein